MLHTVREGSYRAILDITIKTDVLLQSGVQHLIDQYKKCANRAKCTKSKNVIRDA